jgi:hypothetical protein
MDNHITESAASSSPLTNKIVESNNPLKQILIDYVGSKFATEEDEGTFDVTVKMVTDILANEFPEFVLLMAEENWIRGYEQGLNDAGIHQEQTAENSRTSK